MQRLGEGDTLQQDAEPRRQMILATRNPAKQNLYLQAFAPFGWQAITAARAGIELKVAENARTPEANALQKAEAAWSPGCAVFADDAGMEIDALQGEPGTQTRRWNGRFTDDVSDQEWLDYLLQRLAGVPRAERTAKFVTGWALIGPGGQRAVKRVITPFLIAEAPVFPMQPGWPMSAVQVRLPQEEQNVQRLVQRELHSWPFFQQMHADTRNTANP